MPRTKNVVAWFSDAELAAVKGYAEATRSAVAAYVAEASLRPSAWKVAGAAAAEGAGPADRAEPAVGPVLEDAPSGQELRQLLLLELMGLHRQMRVAATNLNQAVAKLNALGVVEGDLSAIAAYVRKVATAVDQAVAEVRMGR